MAAKFAAFAVGVDNHGEGVPANQGADTPLDGCISWAAFLVYRPDGVQVSSGRAVGNVDPRAAGQVDQLFKQVVRTGLAFAFQDRRQRITPLLGLSGVDVGMEVSVSHRVRLCYWSLIPVTGRCWGAMRACAAAS